MSCFNEKFQLPDNNKNNLKTNYDTNSNQPNPDTHKFKSFQETQSEKIGNEISLGSIGKVKGSKECALVCVHELHYEAKPPLDIELPQSTDLSVTGLYRWMYYNKQQVEEFQSMLKNDGKPKMGQVFAEEMKRLYNLMVTPPANVSLYSGQWPIPHLAQRGSFAKVQTLGFALGDSSQEGIREHIFKQIDKDSFSRIESLYKQQSQQREQIQISRKNDSQAQKSAAVLKRVIFHYVGHGTPWLVDNRAEFWLFDCKTDPNTGEEQSVQRYMPTNLHKIIEVTSGRKFYLNESQPPKGLAEGSAKHNREIEDFTLLPVNMIKSTNSDALNRKMGDWLGKKKKQCYEEHFTIDRRTGIKVPSNKFFNKCQMIDPDFPGGNLCVDRQFTIKSAPIPGTFVWDCSKAGILIDELRGYKTLVAKKIKSINIMEEERVLYVETLEYLNKCWHIGSCTRDQLLPFENTQLNDMLSCSLLTPIKLLFSWYARRVLEGEGSDKNMIAALKRVLTEVDNYDLIDFVPDRTKRVPKMKAYLDEHGKPRPEGGPRNTGRSAVNMRGHLQQPNYRNGSRGPNAKGSQSRQTGTDRKTPHGKLCFLFETCAQAILWASLPRPLYIDMFVKTESIHQKMLRNFLVAQRVMTYYNCTPVSEPSIPDCSFHKLWTLFDHIMDKYLKRVVDGLSAEMANEAKLEIEHKHNDQDRVAQRLQAVKQAFDVKPNIEEHTTAFFENAVETLHLWVKQQDPLNSEKKPNYESLVAENFSIIYSCILLKDYRDKALACMQEYVDLGPWAIEDCYSIGILRLLNQLVYKLISNKISILNETRSNFQPWIFIFSKMFHHYDIESLVKIFDLNGVEGDFEIHMSQKGNDSETIMFHDPRVLKGKTVSGNNMAARSDKRFLEMGEIMIKSLERKEYFETYWDSTYSALTLSNLANYLYHVKRMAMEHDILKTNFESKPDKNGDAKSTIPPNARSVYHLILEKFKHERLNKIEVKNTSSISNNATTISFHKELTNTVDDYIDELKRIDEISKHIKKRSMFYKWLFILKGVLWMNDPDAKWEGERKQIIGSDESIEKLLLQNDLTSDKKDTVATPDVRAAIIFMMGTFIGATPRKPLDIDDLESENNNNNQTEQNGVNSQQNDFNRCTPHAISVDTRTVSQILRQEAMEANTIVRLECIKSMAWFLRTYPDITFKIFEELVFPKQNQGGAAGGNYSVPIVQNSMGQNVSFNQGPITIGSMAIGSMRNPPPSTQVPGSLIIGSHIRNNNRNREEDHSSRISGSFIPNQHQNPQNNNNNQVQFQNIPQSQNIAQSVNPQGTMPMTIPPPTTTHTTRNIPDPIQISQSYHQPFAVSPHSPGLSESGEHMSPAGGDALYATGFSMESRQQLTVAVKAVVKKIENLCSDKNLSISKQARALKKEWIDLISEKKKIDSEVNLGQNRSSDDQFGNDSNTSGMSTNFNFNTQNSMTQSMHQTKTMNNLMPGQKINPTPKNRNQSGAHTSGSGGLQPVIAAMPSSVILNISSSEIAKGGFLHRMACEKPADCKNVDGEEIMLPSPLFANYQTDSKAVEAEEQEQLAHKECAERHREFSEKQRGVYEKGVGESELKNKMNPFGIGKLELEDETLKQQESVIKTERIKLDSESERKLVVTPKFVFKTSDEFSGNDELSNLVFHPFDDHLWAVVHNEKRPCIAKWNTSILGNFYMDNYLDDSEDEDYESYDNSNHSKHERTDSNQNLSSYRASLDEEKLMDDEENFDDEANFDRGKSFRKPELVLPMVKNSGYNSGNSDSKISQMHIINPKVGDGLVLSLLLNGTIQIFDINGNPRSSFNATFHRKPTEVNYIFDYIHSAGITQNTQSINSSWCDKEAELAFTVDDKVFIWNCETEQHIIHKPVPLHSKLATSVSWLPSGQELVIGCQDGSILLFDKRSPDASFVKTLEYPGMGRHGRNKSMKIQNFNQWSDFYESDPSFLASYYRDDGKISVDGFTISQLDTSVKFSQKLEGNDFNGSTNFNDLSGRKSYFSGQTIPPIPSNPGFNMGSSAPSVSASSNLPYFVAQTENVLKLYSTNHISMKSDNYDEREPEAMLVGKLAHFGKHEENEIEMAWHPLYPSYASASGNKVHLYKQLDDQLGKMYEN